MRSVIILAFIFNIYNNTHVYSQIPVIVEEKNGINRLNEPVTLGIPFKKGVLISSSSVRLKDNSSNVVNAQFKTMALWNDNTVKWLKCDFQANTNANSISNYNLDLVPQGAISTPLNVTQNDSIITVITGPMKFIVSKKAFNLINQLWLDVNNDSVFTANEEIISSGNQNSGFVVNSSADQPFYSSKTPPDEIIVEESGPMKVVIKVSGVHSSSGSDTLLKYETRIYAYAGKSFIKLWHVYANGKSSFSMGDTGDPAYGQAFNKYSLKLQLNLSGTKKVVFGQADGFPNEYNLSGNSLSLIQRDRAGTGTQMQYNVLNGTSTIGSGGKADGWGDISDNKWGVTLSMRYFWQKYPKGITFSDSGKAELELCPTPEFLWYAMGTGDEIIINFHLPTSNTILENMVKSLNKNPLFPRTSPEQYASSYAFYDLLPGNVTLFPGMDKYIKQVNENHLINRETLALFGNVSFGDTPRDIWEVDPDTLDASVWGSNYYDWTLTAIKLFCQTGDVSMTDIFIPGNFHFRETACFNTYEKDSWIIGFCPAYSQNHRSTGHFEQHYAENLWYYYYLTGDERSREIGLRAAESITDRQVWANDNVACRVAYQRASTTLEAYKNTHDNKYLLNAKRLLIDKVLATQDTFGLIGGVDFDNSQITGEQAFMIALYSETLWKYIKESDNPDQVLIQKFVKLADFFDKYSRKNSGEEVYWNFFSPPSNVTLPAPDTLSGEPVVYWDGLGLIAGTYAFAYDLTQDIKYKNLALNLLDFMWGDSLSFMGSFFWGKASAQTMKNMIHAVAIVSRIPTGILGKNADFPNELILYPNPAKTGLNIIVNGLSQEIKNISFYNSNGVKINIPVPINKVRNHFIFDISKLSKGIYFVNVQFKDGTFRNEKFINLN